MTKLHLVCTWIISRDLRQAWVGYDALVALASFLYNLIFRSFVRKWSRLQVFWVELLCLQMTRTQMAKLICLNRLLLFPALGFNFSNATCRILYEFIQVEFKKFILKLKSGIVFLILWNIQFPVKASILSWLGHFSLLTKTALCSLFINLYANLFSSICVTLVGHCLIYASHRLDHLHNHPSQFTNQLPNKQFHLNLENLWQLWHPHPVLAPILPRHAWDGLLNFMSAL